MHNVELEIKGKLYKFEIEIYGKMALVELIAYIKSQVIMYLKSKCDMFEVINDCNDEYQVNLLFISVW